MAQQPINQQKTKSSPLQRSMEDYSKEAAQERRYLWMTRAYALIFVVAICVNILGFITFKSLFPLVRVQPFYIYTQDKSDQIIKIVRPNPKNISVDVMSESLLRQYLLARLSVTNDLMDLENRWGYDGIVQWYSANSVFQEFSETAPQLIEQARNEGLERNVRILTLQKYRTEPDGVVWRAEIELSDMKLSFPEPKVSKWVVFMKVNYAPDRPGLRWSQRLKNPLGFMITNYGMQLSE